MRLEDFRPSDDHSSRNMAVDRRHVKRGPAILALLEEGGDGGGGGGGNGREKVRKGRCEKEEEERVNT